MVLAWVPCHVNIGGNQMADTLSKEATKMITTLKLPFTDYKTQIKHYIRRKWQTIWDMFPNNKLYKHQPKIRIGHIYLTHAYLLKGETAPWCTCCNQLLTVSHILVDCKKYKNICKKSYHTTTFALLFKDVPTSQMIEYLKKNRLLPTPIEQTLLEIGLTILSLIHVQTMFGIEWPTVVDVP